jgi:DNA helicase-2/ATP-dependent DNA helicase PcrA
MKQRGREMLKGFYEKVYDPRQKPLSLEQVFKISLNSNLKLGGKIDRVDNLQEGRIEIIDYKTGKKPKEKEIRENLQMTVYALAATDSGIYNKKSSEVVLSFYFFETFEKISSTRTDQDLQSAKEKIIKTAKEIENSSFEPKVSNLCDFCDYRMICKAWQ